MIFRLLVAGGLIHHLDYCLLIIFPSKCLLVVHFLLVMPILLILRFLAKYRNFHYILAISEYMLF